MYRRIVAAVLAVALAVLVAPSLAVAGAAAKPAPTSKVNLNTASAEQLATLPGVGPALAGRIVEYRQKSGSFRATKDVMNVKGIGEKNFAKIEAWLTVGDAPKAAASNAIPSMRARLPCPSPSNASAAIAMAGSTRSSATRRS